MESLLATQAYVFGLQSNHPLTEHLHSFLKITDAKNKPYRTSTWRMRCSWERRTAMGGTLFCLLSFTILER